MSAKTRADAEALRAKYARAFRVPKEDVVIEFQEDDNYEDAIVFHKTDVRLPRWSLGTPERRPAHATIAEWNEKTGSRFVNPKRFS